MSCPLGQHYSLTNLTRKRPFINALNAQIIKKCNVDLCNTEMKGGSEGAEREIVINMVSPKGEKRESELVGGREGEI